jgi:hypothetical protein
VSAISKTEFYAACVVAGRQHAFLSGPKADKAAETIIRAFFAALPADVKLMRREPTEEMLAVEYLPETWPQMFDAAPPSLPEAAGEGG